MRRGRHGKYGKFIYPSHPFNFFNEIRMVTILNKRVRVGIRVTCIELVPLSSLNTIRIYLNKTYEMSLYLSLDNFFFFFLRQQLNILSLIG